MLILLIVPFASSMYAGESLSIQLEKPFAYYSIVGNSSEVNLEIFQEGNNVTIIPDKYSKADSYEIVFFDIEKEVVTVYSGGGGGTRYIYKTNNITEIEFVEKPIEKEVIKEIVKEVPVEKIKEVKSKIYPFLISFGILAFILIIIYSRLIFIQMKGGKENEEN